MSENLFATRRSFAAEPPGAPALVRHILKYSSTDLVFLWGAFDEDWLESAGTPLKDNTTVRVPATTSAAEIFNQFGSARPLLIARFSKGDVPECGELRAVIDRSEYTLALSSEKESAYRADLLSTGDQHLFSGKSSVLDRAEEVIDVYSGAPIPQRTPQSFRVGAILAAHNEADIILHSLAHLFAQGIDVYFIDNWSSDGTYEMVREQYGERLLGLERFPQEGPASSFDLHDLLCRKEAVAQSLEVAWVIHQDADEFRYAPFETCTLRDGVYIADQAGYNALNHTVIEFPPTGSEPVQGSPERALEHFRFGRQPSDLVQVKAWKKERVPVSLATSAGHQVIFEGRRIYPFNYLLKHYPVRSQEHGSRKIFEERLPRYSSACKEKGWHVHYTRLEPAHRFAESRAALIKFEESDFHSRFLIQRLTGCGIGQLTKYL